MILIRIYNSIRRTNGDGMGLVRVFDLPLSTLVVKRFPRGDSLQKIFGLNLAFPLIDNDKCGCYIYNKKKM